MQTKVRKPPPFSLASHAPIALGVIPWGPKYAQQPWKGSDLPQVSEMGNSFSDKPSYYTSACKSFNFEQPSLYRAWFVERLPDQPNQKRKSEFWYCKKDLRIARFCDYAQCTSYVMGLVTRKSKRISSSEEFRTCNSINIEFSCQKLYQLSYKGI